MRPLAPLRTELTISGAGSTLVGIGGLVGGIVLSSSPVRAIVPFTLISVLLAVVQYLSGFGWVRRTADAAPRMPADARLEPHARTIRRTVLALMVIAGAVAVTLVYRGELAAIIGGVAFGVGVVDLYAARWVAGREATAQVTLLRESAASPVAGGRRPVYTLPTNAKTLAT